MPDIRYTGPSMTAHRAGRCPTCGKRVRRSRTFSQTVSPFNRHPDGRIKTPAEVADAVRAQADAWSPGPELFEHDACADARMSGPAPTGEEKL